MKWAIKKITNWLFTNYKGEKVAWYWNVASIMLIVILLGFIF